MKNKNLPDNAIEIKGLSKKYNGIGGAKDLLALDSIDLEIPRGSMFGLLGPNGAGKSTFINILAGLTLKTNGKAIVWGFDLDKNPRSVRASLGVVPQEIYVDPFFSPRETLHQQAGMYGVQPKDRNVDFLLKTLDLEDKADSYTRTLSGGMKRRLLVAKSMVHRPPILILDEPTAGVDIELRQQLWTYIRKLNEHGTTIILTTHYLEEAEELCDTIAIVDNGQIVRCAPTKEILNDADSKTIIIKTSDSSKDLNSSLKEMGAVIDKDQNILIGYNPKNETSRDILRKVEDSGILVNDFSVSGASLETVFLSITSKN
jgi:ABC-2 type transport system ATP-binding protein